MKVYVVYRIDKMIVGSGYYMPLDMHVFSNEKNAIIYLCEQGCIKDVKRKCYGITHWKPTCPCYSGKYGYVMEEIDMEDFTK